MLEPRSLPSFALGSAAAVHKLDRLRFSEKEGGKNNRQRGDYVVVGGKVREPEAGGWGGGVRWVKLRNWFFVF